ncbi:MAG: Rpn family recombination-promoting nuclease/putative transposase [Muribaculaceae bacterium]|nr:Rpn family recombination-promoting nuclease/putative transposase [Muribaculaceae bacterium]
MSTENSIYINPLTDFGFKYIFGRNADKEFTVSFLNALKIGPKPIKNITFVDKENKGESKDDRALIYDLHCELEDGRKIIVEMQNRYQVHFDDRALYYMAADLYAQGQKGDWDYELTPVYGVFVMNFEWKDVKEQHLREDVCLYNMQTKKVFSDKMTMTFLKIPMLHKNAEECKTTLERWIYILKHMEKMEAIPQTFMQDPVFRKLDQVAQYGALNESDKIAYNQSLKAYRDAYAIYKTERNVGRAEGIAEGRADERIAIAENLIKMNNLSDEMIAQATNLKLEEVLALRMKLSN